MSKRILFFLLFLFEGSQVGLFIMLPYIQKDLNINIFYVGIYGMILAVSSIVCTFFSAPLADKIGNRRVILISVVSGFISWVLLVTASTPIHVGLAFAVSGITTGLFDPLGNALVALMSTPQTRGKSLGDYKAIGDMGKFSMTSAITAIIAIYYWRTTSVVLAIFSGVLVAFFIINKTRSHSKLGNNQKDTQTNFESLFHQKRFMFTLIAGVCDSFASSSLFIFLPFLLIPKGIDMGTAGYITSIFFIGYFVGRLSLGRMSDIFGASRMLIIGEVFMALLIIMAINLQSYWVIMIDIFLLGIFTAGTSPVVKAMTAESLEQHQYKHGFGLYSSVMKTVNIISRPVFGFVAAYFGIQATFYLASGVALITIIPTAIYDRLKGS
ncbi:MFS transporter [Candidatus Woesebacteria bacterium]|nr:MFS transporter [Candidatus Woesebacteria bacterium]